MEPTPTRTTGFGDKHVDEAVQSITQQIHQRLSEKRHDMHPIHKERLQNHGFSPMDDDQAEHFSMDQNHLTNSSTQTMGSSSSGQGNTDHGK